MNFISTSTGEYEKVVTKHLLDLLKTHRSIFNIALSGGNTPRKLYTYLGNHAEFLSYCSINTVMITDNIQSSINEAVQYYNNKQWTDSYRCIIHFYFGDDRVIEATSELNNYNMAYTSLLHKMHKDSVFPIPCTPNLSIDQRAVIYSRIIKENVPIVNQLPQFDLVLLGFGPDGHTASLFPNHPTFSSKYDNESHLYYKYQDLTITQLNDSDTKANLIPVSELDIAVPSFIYKEFILPALDRVTLTKNVILNAKQVFVIAFGSDKKWIMDYFKDSSLTQYKPICSFLKKSVHNVTIFTDLI